MGWDSFTLDQWANLTLDGWATMGIESWEANYTISDTYDCAGNRLVNTNLGVLTTYSYDGANQLETSQDATGTTNYTYDDAGNLHLIEAPGARRLLIPGASITG